MRLRHGLSMVRTAVLPMLLIGAVACGGKELPRAAGPQPASPPTAERGIASSAEPAAPRRESPPDTPGDRADVGEATAPARPALALPASGVEAARRVRAAVEKVRVGSPRRDLGLALLEAVERHGGELSGVLRTVYRALDGGPALLTDPVAGEGCARALPAPDPPAGPGDGPPATASPPPEPPPACAALLAALRALPEHAIDPKPYHIEEVEAAVARFGRFREAVAEQRRSPFDDTAGEALWETALLAFDGADEGALRRRAAAAGAPDRLDDRLPTVSRWLADLAAADNALRAAWAVADVTLLRSFVRYALDFRYLRRTNPYRKPDELPERIAKVRRGLLRQVERARENLPATLAALRPRHPLYDRLRAFLPVYRGLAAAGSIEPFRSSRRLRRRHHGKDVAQLRERLRAEGFDPGPPGDLFDDTLRDAVIAFQSTRGVAPIGEVGPQTREALNVSMEQRLRQIEISLRRWRESPSRSAEGRYVRINIPRYELQLWDGDRLLRRHKVIVGSGAVVTDLRSHSIGYLNRTRLVSSRIYQIILNPYWRVPARIAVQEIGPQAERDPDYLASHGFAITAGPGGETLYVQKPGKKNPLGKVKFLFRNDYALYLHDTDKRWLFRETARDFSHGCIRIDDPLELARAIARSDRNMSDQDFGRLLRMGTEYGIDLHDPLPIYIEYVTASVDGEGRLLLLPDVYRFDRAVTRGRLPVRTKRRMKPAEIERAEARLRKKAGRD